jgi:hypothetical protein
MDAEPVIAVDDPKLKIDSIAVIVRRRGASSTAADSSQGGGSPLADVVFGICVGTNDGCVALYATSRQDETSIGSGNGSNGTHKLFSTAKRIHKRSLDSGKAPVTAIIPEYRLKEPRLVCLCNGKVTMVNAESFDLLHTFANVKNLEGVSAVCVSQPIAGASVVNPSFSEETSPFFEASAASNSSMAGASSSGVLVKTPGGHTAKDTPRLAAVVKQRILLFDFGESSCVPCVTTTGQQLQVGDGVVQVEWTSHYVIVATNRDYSVYDCKSTQLLDQLVFGKAQPGPMLRVLSNGVIGVKNVNALVLWGQDRGTTFETAPAISLADQGAPANANEDLAVFARCPPFNVLCNTSGKVVLRSTLDNGQYPTAPKLATTQGAVVRAAASRHNCLFIATQREVFGAVPQSAMNIVQGYIGAGLLPRATAHYAAALQPSEATPVAMHSFETGLQHVHLLCAREAVKLGQLQVALEHFEHSRCDVLSILPHFPQLHSKEAQKLLSASASSSVETVTLTAGAKQGTKNVSGVPTLKLLQVLKKQRVRDLADVQQRALDFAILMMLIGDCIADTFMDATDRALEIDDFLLPSNNLDYDEAARVISVVEGMSPASPRLLLRAGILLRATHERQAEALQLAKKNRLVEEATMVLQQNSNVAFVTDNLPWMLVANARAAVQAVCVRDSPISPEVVLSMLSGCSTSVLRQYLYFAIYENGLTDGDLHTQYACTLLREMESLRGLSDTAGWMTLSEMPGDEAGLYGDLRRELLMFLGGSRHYDGDAVLAALRSARASGETPFSDYDRGQGLVETHDEPDAPGSSSTNGTSIGSASKALVKKPARDRLVRFYSKYKPEGMSQVDEILSSFAGKEEELFIALEKKYGPEPIDDPNEVSSSYDRRRKRASERKLRSKWLMHEEALIHARHGDHSAVLTLFVYKLNDIRLAEQYCFSQFVTDHDRRTGSTAATLSPGIGGARKNAGGVSPTTNGLVIKGTPSTVSPGARRGGQQQQQQPPLTPTTKRRGAAPRNSELKQSARISACLSELIVVLLIPPEGYPARRLDALRVLDAHSVAINPTAVLEAMPGDVPFASIAPYIARVAVRNADQRTISEVTKESLRTRQFELERLKIALQRRSIYIDRDRPCCVCKKPLGTTIFGVFPNLKTAHFRCFKDKDYDPLRGVPFKAVVEPLWWTSGAGAPR